MGIVIRGKQRSVTMVRARIHIICGNCGCNNMFSWELTDLFNSEDDCVGKGPVLTCHNCSTIHFIANEYPRKQECDNAAS